MIELRKLSKTYRNNLKETVALHSINIEIKQGEFVAIMGPSGCGKSTLLNIIGLLDNPTTGQYTFSGKDVSHFNESKLCEARKHSFGFIFQNFNLIDELTVEENIELALLYHKMSHKERKFRVTEVMDSVAIAHRAKHMPNQLSGGQQQRVAIARAIVGDQPIILADEPTGNLDSSHGQEVMKMLQSLNEAGTTIIIATHSLVHADYARRTIHLFDGGVINESLYAHSDF